MSILVFHFTVVGGFEPTMCPEIPKDDLRRPTNDVFVLFSVCGVTLSKDRFRYAISLKREDFKDVRQNATRNVMVLKSCFLHQNP